MSKGIREVKAKWVIGLDEGTELKVKQGDEIEKGDVLAVLEKKQKIKSEAADLMLKFGREKLIEKLREKEGKEVKKDEPMFKLPGLFGKKVFWPETGKFLGIDEFGSFVFESDEREKTELISPVSAKVEEVSSNKIILSFRAKEFRGKPVMETKIWCESCLRELESLTDLDCNYEGGLLFCQSLDEVFLAKAEVMSVAGIVSVESNVEVETDLPILFLNKNDWEALHKMMDGERKQMLLNTRLGRLLVVV